MSSEDMLGSPKGIGCDIPSAKPKCSGRCHPVELKVERELVDDLHAVRRERLLDLVAPDLNVGDNLAVEQQQRMRTVVTGSSTGAPRRPESLPLHRGHRR